MMTIVIQDKDVLKEKPLFKPIGGGANLKATVKRIVLKRKKSFR